MCYQIVELYSQCRCLYYQHPVDRCQAYGKRGHYIQQRTIYVGYSCSDHDHRDDTNPASLVTLSPPDWDTASAAFSTDRDKSYSIRADSDVWSAAPSHTASDTSDDVPHDEAADLIHTLLRFKNLRFLWPQVIQRSGSPEAAFHKTQKFIQGYLDDLTVLLNLERGSGLPWPSVDELPDYLKNIKSKSKAQRKREARIRAEKFSILSMEKVNVARSISGAYRPLLGLEPECPSVFELSGTSPNTFEVGSFEGSPRDIGEEFLFHTSPIASLQSRIVGSLRQLPPPNLFTRLRERFRARVLNFLDTLERTPVGDDARRIEWICKCGRRIFDDYKPPPGVAHLQERAPWKFVESFAEELGAYSPSVTSPETGCYEDSGSQGPGKSWSAQLSSLYGSLVTRVTSFRAPGLPQHKKRAQRDHGRIGVCPPPATGGPPFDHNFLLLCLPFMRTATKLLQLEVCTVFSDREFFHALAHHYSSSRGRESWARLRKVRSLKFVEFEVFHSELVNIRQCPGLPPQDRLVAEYACEATGMVPPVESNLLMHLFENPDHAEVLPVLFRRIPRKLRSKLTACPQKGSSVGWGIQVDEGLNWVGLFVWGSIGFVVCLVVAVAWTLARDDVQGGFAIASFMLAFLVFCGGLAHAEMATW